METNNQISWHTEITIKPGEFENFQNLNEDMVAWAKTEPGTLIYERFLSDDAKTVYIYERYIDSEAAIAHLKVFIEKYGHQFMTMVDRKRFLVLGSPSDELRAIFDGFNADYGNPFGGFLRV